MEVLILKVHITVAEHGRALTCIFTAPLPLRVRQQEDERRERGRERDDLERPREGQAVMEAEGGRGKMKDRATG